MRTFNDYVDKNIKAFLTTYPPRLVHVVIDPLIFSVYDVKAGPWTLDFKGSLNYYVDINFVLFNHQTTSTRTFLNLNVDKNGHLPILTHLTLST